MAKTRPSKSRRKRLNPASASTAPPDPETLLSTALAHLQTSSTPEILAETALPLAHKALQLLYPQSLSLSPSASSDLPPRAALPALSLLGQIYLALDEEEEAFEKYKLAARAIEGNIASGSVNGEKKSKQSGRGGRGVLPGSDEADDAEIYLWLAQLDPEGGRSSVEWFERGAEILRREITKAEKNLAEHPARNGKGNDEDERITALKTQLSKTLCSVTEIWMTDLSLDPAAEQTCLTLTTEALLLSPQDPTPYQTLASIRISQSDLPSARKLLHQALSLWNLSPASPGSPSSTSTTSSSEDSPAVLTDPDFAPRVSLIRLLLETHLVAEARSVCDALLREDEEALEVWYLGGCGAWIEAGMEGPIFDGWEKVEVMAEEWRERYKKGHLKVARRWLNTALGLYEKIGYQDERLRGHARELVGKIREILGEEDDDEDEDEDGEDEGEWEDEDSDEESKADQEMADG